MKLVLLFVALTAVYTANCRDQDSNIEALLFPDEPANTDITGEDQLLPNEQVDDASIGETQRVLIGQENQNIDEEVQQMKENYEMGSVSDHRSSMTKERKRCIPTISCTSAGGHCVKKSGDCKGTVDRYGCRGSKKCKCCIPADITCIPVQTTAAPTTTRDTTTTTTPTTTTAAPTTTSTDTTTTTTPTTTTAATTTTTTDTTTTTPTTTTAATTTTTTDTTTTTTPTTTTAAPTTTTTDTTTTTTPTTTTAATTTTTTASTTTTSDLECLGGFLMLDQCFRIFNDTRRSWDAAQSKCQLENLILAEPSDSVAAPLREYVLKNYGAGNYECWVGARGDGSKFVWQHSGKSLLGNNSLWDDGPLRSSQMSSSSCSELDVLQGEWAAAPGKPYDSVSCTYSRWTLCEDTTTTTTPTTTTAATTTTTTASTTTTSDLECLGGFFLVLNQCFRIFNDTRRSFEAAQSKCRLENLILAEPSDSVAAPLREYVVKNYGNYECWVGARGNGSKFLWQQSGKSLLGNNSLWDDGPLHSSQMSSSYCSELDVLQGEWAAAPGKPYDSVSCTNSRWTLCEGSTFSPNLNWLTVGADRFVKYNQTMSWTDARNVCRSDGLDLYQPRNILAVSKYLDTNHFSGSSNVYFWLGGQGNGTHQLWFSGSVVPANAPWYSNYASSVGTNHCMLLFTYGGYADKGTVLGAYNCLDTTNMRPLCG